MIIKTKKDKQDDKSIGVGHRKRLKAQFLKLPIRSLHDYQILEMILFSVSKRSDTKVLAKTLLQKFKSLSSIFEAPIDELKRIKGLGQKGAQYLLNIGTLFQELQKEDVLSKDYYILSSRHAVLTYCELLCKVHKKDGDSVRLLFLNRKNTLIADQGISTKDMCEASISPTELIEQALIYHAVAIIIVKYQEDLIDFPKKHDVETAKLIMKTLSTIDVSLHDYLIITNKTHISFRGYGLL